jgi:peptidoglycan-associated lipoprotein
MLRRVAARLLFLGAAFACAAAIAGCRPNYPACDGDEDCNRDEKRTVKEYCVNKLCQQCRDEKDCKAGQRCNKGRCDAIPGWCADDGGCSDGQVCREHACQACTGDAQCGEGGHCKQGRCIRKGGCQSDDDCAQSEDCKAGRCVPAAPRKASQDAPCHLQSVLFDFNESVLSLEATAAIDANAACINKVGRAVQIIGRSDPRGTEEYNLALSERRALSVKERLQRLGVDVGKLRTLPRGELDATGKDEAGWAQDRRVDFEWQ